MLFFDFFFFFFFFLCHFGFVCLIIPSLSILPPLLGDGRLGWWILHRPSFQHLFLLMFSYFSYTQPLSQTGEETLKKGYVHAPRVLRGIERWSKIFFVLLQSVCFFHLRFSFANATNLLIPFFPQSLELYAHATAEKSLGSVPLSEIVSIEMSNSKEQATDEVSLLFLSPLFLFLFFSLNRQHGSFL